MTPARAKELIPIITAFANGETVQTRVAEEAWFDARRPTWRDDWQYRIKPKPRLRPWTSEEAPRVFVVRARHASFWDASVARRPDNERWVNVFIPASVLSATATLQERILSVSFADLLRNYVHILEDGSESPCGVMEVGDE